MVYSYAILHHPQHPAFDYPVRRGAGRSRRRACASCPTWSTLDPTTFASACPSEVTFEPTADDMAVPVFEPRESGRHEPRSLDGTPRSSVSARPSSPRRPAAARPSSPAKPIVAALADAGLGHRRRRRFGQLHHRSGRGDRTRAGPRDTARSAVSSRVPYGGGGSQGVLLHAAAAVASGAAEVVVAYRAVKARSGARFGRAEVAGRRPRRTPGRRPCNGARRSACSRRRRGCR